MFITTVLLLNLISIDAEALKQRIAENEGREYQMPQRQIDNSTPVYERRSRVQAASCQSGSLAPLASPGCSNLCVNGQWAEVCK